MDKIEAACILREPRVNVPYYKTDVFREMFSPYKSDEVLLFKEPSAR